MRRGRGEGGVTIVEAAFAIPILFTFTFGLLDLGMWAYNANQASNAARDGARTGILSYQLADVEGSADWDAIVASIEGNLAGRAVEEIDVDCLEPDDSDIACADARVDVDRIRVEASWHWDVVSPIAGIIGVDRGLASGTATMAIVGRPCLPEELGGDPTDPGTCPPASTTTSTSTSTTSTTSTTIDPEECAVTDITVSPNPVPGGYINGSGMMKGEISISYDTSAVDRCDGLAVQLRNQYGEPDSAVCESCVDGTSHHSWKYSSNKKIWKHGGPATVEIFNSYEDETGQQIEQRWTGHFTVTGA